MIKIFTKNPFILCRVTNKTNLVLKIIKKEITNSVFFYLDFYFFKKLIKKKIISVFVIKKKNKITAIISVVETKNFFKLKYDILLFFFRNPHKLILNIFSILKSSLRGSSNFSDNEHLHLLHLIIFKNYFKKISLKKKDKIINIFFKKILIIFNAKSLFLCYDIHNLSAKKYYKRNNFTIYDRNNSTIFLKKKFK